LFRICLGEFIFIIMIPGSCI